MLNEPFPDADNVYVGDKHIASVKDTYLVGKRAIVLSLPGAFTPV